jgi:hypothetical protein
MINSIWREIFRALPCWEKHNEHYVHYLIKNGKCTKVIDCIIFTVEKSGTNKSLMMIKIYPKAIKHDKAYVYDTAISTYSRCFLWNELQAA